MKKQIRKQELSDYVKRKVNVRIKEERDKYNGYWDGVVAVELRKAFDFKIEDMGARIYIYEHVKRAYGSLTSLFDVFPSAQQRSFTLRKLYERLNDSLGSV